MDIPYLMAHPEELDQETLYDLRRLVGVHPTFHAARILFLQNLFLLHDTTFDQELRRAALLVPDRRVLCNITQFGGLQPMLDRARRQLRKEAEEMADVTETSDSGTTTETPAPPPVNPGVTEKVIEETAPAPAEIAASAADSRPSVRTTPTQRPKKKYATGDTTSILLDSFLDSTPAPLQRRKIKADPATDYMAYILQQDEVDNATGGGVDTAANAAQSSAATAPASADERMDELISGFITSYENGIQLSENPSMPEDILLDPEEMAAEAAAGVMEAAAGETKAATVAAEAATKATGAAVGPPEAATNSAAKQTVNAAATMPSPTSEPEGETEAASLTETLAAIYIKQQKYDRAIEVINKLHTAPAGSQTQPSKAANPYYADQVRFLQKLAIINRNKR